MLQDKGRHDNELIDTLMTQQEKLQVIIQNVAQQNSKSSVNELEVRFFLYSVLNFRYYFKNIGLSLLYFSIRIYAFNS